MKHHKIHPAKSLGRVQSLCNRRTDSRHPADFGLMYSAIDQQENLIMGDGTVIDISYTGLKIRGNISVKPAMEMTLFLYLPDGQDPLFVMEARVAWSAGHRFGVEILKMNLRERNRLHYFLLSSAMPG